MDRKHLEDKMHKRLNERKINISNNNAFEALFTLLPPAHALWKIFKGAGEKIQAERSAITQDMILDFLISIDNKLSGITLSNKQKHVFKVLLESIVASGDVTGIKGSTSSPIFRKLFADNEVSVILKNINAIGNVTGVDLSVGEEMELKHKFEVKSDNGSVTFNPNAGKIVFGKKTDSESNDKKE